MSRVAAGALASALAKAVAAGKIPRVVTALGPESLLRDQVAATVAKVLLGDAASPDVVVVQGAAGSTEGEREAMGSFFDETRTGSLFGTAKVVVLRNAGPLASRQKKDFGAWLKAPGSAATAVILADDLPRALATAAESAGWVVGCGGRGRARGESPVRFVQRRVAESGKRIAPRDAQLLVDLLGLELSSLDSAVEMLCLHAADTPEVSRTDVDALFESAREGSLWSFGDRLVEGDPIGAMEEAGRCFAEGIPEGFGSRRVTRNESAVTIRLLSSFSRSLLRALLVRRQLDRGVPRSQLHWGRRPPPPAAQRRTLQVVSRRRTRALEALLLFAEETERALKTGGVQGRIAVAKLATAVGMVR